MSITATKLPGVISKQYLAKYGWMPTLTLANLMARENPDVFASTENARTSLRYFRGHQGSAHRKTLSTLEFVTPEGSSSDRTEPALPKPIDDLFKWEVKPVDFERGLILCDIHLPFHSLNELKLSIDYGRNRNADCIILNGDTLDFYALSFFEKDPKMWDAAVEQKQGTEFLEYLRATFPKAQIIFKEGNHEERLWRWVAAKNPGLMYCVQTDGKTPLLGLKGFLPFDKFGVTVIDNKQPMIVCDKLYILHGHEFPSPITSPVNPARGLFLQSKANAVCGHLHQSSFHTEAGLGSPISCFSFGSLCHLRPRYRPLNKWNFGFGFIETNKGAWSVESKKIINGTIV